MGRPPLPLEVRRRFWEAVTAGASEAEAAAAAGVSPETGKRWLRQAGGVKPRIGRARALSLSVDERAMIARLHYTGERASSIARILGRSPSTITRELARGKDRYGRYVPTVAQARADAAARRPQESKLARNHRLREQVQAGLDRKHSPEQIAGRLREDFPDEPEMWVSPESIYQGLYVQGRGGLKREVTVALRTGRAMRKPRRTHGIARRGRPVGMVNISQRPAEADDRAIPGHWEGDLIMGAGNRSAIGTLVERTTGFVVLLHLPADHSAATVAAAMTDAIPTIPELLRRSLAWDQGSEMALHTAITEATGLPIYFADPHSPWQRATNENTNGLLRQYFPKGTDLSFHGPGILANVAAELNARPRKRHNWATPAEVLDRFLTDNQPFAPTA